jgi:predicted O-linked N-acetylglucosamine transferase (SPINDLY family)
MNPDAAPVPRSVHSPAPTPDQLLREGLRRHQAGQLAEAEAIYRQLLAREPKHPDALHYIGVLAYQAGNYAASARLIGEAVALKDDAAACINLGNALAMLKRLPDAQAALEKGLALAPANADAWFNLGNIQREREQLAAADASYRRALALNPAHGGALNNLANLLCLAGRNDEAATAFCHLADLLQGCGRTEDAANAYRQAQAIAPDTGIETALALLTPALPASVAEIDATRERLAAGIAALCARGIALADPLRYASSAIFYTGYHGRDDRALRRDIADFYLGATPSLGYRAPHCTGYAGAGERIRIGFVSKFFRPDHPMSKLYGGIVDALYRGRFDVTIFRFGPADAMGFGADTPIVTLGDDLAAAREAIAAARLDVLFYTDIGMAPTTYFLAFARLAPVQCVTFGHPVTTGIANVDYFVSAAELEGARAEEHYTETLVRLAVVPTCFRRPAAAPVAPTREALGLPADARLYFCAQNLIKFHPEFDAALAGILRRDPKALLVLINNANPSLVQCLRNRFRAAMPDVAPRVAFLPFLDLDALLAFARHADAVLDTPVFCGGTTSLEMFAVDVPIVTWPGEFARGRITHALYRQMGIEGLSARDATGYADIALRVATDPAFKREKQDELRRKKDVLYENVAVVRELERFLEAAVAAAARGRTVSGWGR